jgi:hypothetical protein
VYGPDGPATVGTFDHVDGDITNRMLWPVMNQY